MENYYQLLDIDFDANVDVIKKRCQELLLQHHPDKKSSSDSTSSIFLKVQEARKILLNPEHRQDYDRKLKEIELEDHQPPIFSQVALDELEFDEGCFEYYTECRCGGRFSLNETDIQEKTVTYVPCDNCTFHLVVSP